MRVDFLGYCGCNAKQNHPHHRRYLSDRFPRIDRLHHRQAPSHRRLHTRATNGHHHSSHHRSHPHLRHRLCPAARRLRTRPSLRRRRRHHRRRWSHRRRRSRPHQLGAGATTRGASHHSLPPHTHPCHHLRNDNEPHRHLDLARVRAQGIATGLRQRHRHRNRRQ